MDQMRERRIQELRSRSWVHLLQYLLRKKITEAQSDSSLQLHIVGIARLLCSSTSLVVSILLVVADIASVPGGLCSRWCPPSLLLLRSSILGWCPFYHVYYCIVRTGGTERLACSNRACVCPDSQRRRSQPAIYSLALIWSPARICLQLPHLCTNESRLRVAKRWLGCLRLADVLKARALSFLCLTHSL